MLFKTYACKILKYTCPKTKCRSHSEQRDTITPCPARQGSCPGQTGLALNAQPMCTSGGNRSSTNKPSWTPATPARPRSQPGSASPRPARQGSSGTERRLSTPSGTAERSEAVSAPRAAGTRPGHARTAPGAAMRGLRAPGLPRAQPDPEQSVPVPLTLAGADEEISVRGDAAEGQVHHGPRVAGAGERGLPHGHGGGGAWAGHESGGPGSGGGGGGSDGQEALPGGRASRRGPARGVGGRVSASLCWASFIPPREGTAVTSHPIRSPSHSLGQE